MLSERVQTVLQEIETLNLDERQSLIEYINRQVQKDAEAKLSDNQSSNRENGEPEFYQELEWLREHRHEYGGQYVAIVGGNMIANGLEPRTVLRCAREAGHATPLIVRIEAPDELPFGGW